MTYSSSSYTPTTYSRGIPMVPIAFGPLQQPVTCPMCHRKVVTTVTPKAGLMAWGVCALMLLSGVSVFLYIELVDCIAFGKSLLLLIRFIRFALLDAASFRSVWKNARYESDRFFIRTKTNVIF